MPLLRTVLTYFRRAIYGLVYALAFGLVYGLVFCPVCGLVFGLLGGLVTDLRTRAISNQGIQASFKNSVIATLLLVGLILLLQLALKPLLLTIFSAQETASLLSYLPVLSLSGLFVGGLAWMQHLALRLVLYFSVQKRGDWETRCIPWNYARFLDYTADRRLIQQVGGRYRFIHRTLMEHLAHMSG